MAEYEWKPVTEDGCAVRIFEGAIGIDKAAARLKLAAAAPAMAKLLLRLVALGDMIGPDDWDYVRSEAHTVLVKAGVRADE